MVVRGCGRRGRGNGLLHLLSLSVISDVETRVEKEKLWRRRRRRDSGGSDGGDGSDCEGSGW